MTPEQLELVQTSYASLGDAAPTVARDFYRRLFAADPSVEALFSAEPEVMAEKFADELAAIVQAIVAFDAFALRVRALADRHVAYGVRTHHYQTVGEALVAALAAHLGPEWTPAHDTAWRRAFNLVAELMMSQPGSAGARP